MEKFVEIRDGSDINENDSILLGMN